MFPLEGLERITMDLVDPPDGIPHVHCYQLKGIEVDISLLKDIDVPYIIQVLYLSYDLMAHVNVPVYHGSDLIFQIHILYDPVLRLMEVHGCLDSVRFHVHLRTGSFPLQIFLFFYPLVYLFVEYSDLVKVGLNIHTNYPSCGNRW